MALTPPFRAALIFMPLILFAMLAAVILWPDPLCDNPRCARKRFSLFVELDSFRGIEPISMEVRTPTETISARNILLSGGIDLSIEPDENTLPYEPESGPLDRADLYQYALAWRNRAAPSRVDAQIYAIVTPALVSDRGERLFGIMFDSAGREGIAIAPRQTVRTFETREAESIPLLQLRTFMHELLHALNRRHLDAAQMDGRVTLEAPTRCITGSEGSHWYLTEPPLMSLSPLSIQFFQTAEARDVLPGGANTPFDGMRSSATECADVRENKPDGGASSRWNAAKRRLLSVIGIQSAQAQDTSPTEESSPSLSLQVQAQDAAYPLGYPIAIRLMVRNESDQPLPLKERLAPAYGLVQIEYRFKDAEAWQPFKPLMWYEPVDDEAAMLEPGEYAEQTAAIYFGDGGWTFPQPGEYELRAALKPGEDSADILSNSMPIRIAPAQSEADRAVLQPLLDDEGELDADIGRLLTFGGRIGDGDAHIPIQAAVGRYPSTALGSALKLTLASQRLSPAIDPLTGQRGRPDLSGAEDLLDDTCTDSGIAALKDELLQRFEDQLPPAMTERLQSSAEAWDGTTAERDLVRTYSDPELQPYSATVHFCWNDGTMKRDIYRAATKMAHDLKRASPARLVIVGHADYEGTCQFNEKLGLRRAESVKELLTRNGFPEDRIRTVSLGERHPLDFSSSEQARQLNRRVEILLERQTSETEDEPQDHEVTRLLPTCKARSTPAVE